MAARSMAAQMAEGCRADTGGRARAGAMVPTP